MVLPNAFDPQVVSDLLGRLGALTPDSSPRWGKMRVAQMLAHCCVPYEQLAGENGGVPRFAAMLARLFFKASLVGDKPFSRNLPTAKAFIIQDPRDFQEEQDRLRGFIRRFHVEEAEGYEGRVHVTFGALTSKQWSNLLYKHLDHHLAQFGV